MAKKFEIIGASLVVFDTISGDILLETPKRDSFYSYRDLRDNQIVRIFDTNGASQSGSGLANYPLSDCVDSSLTSFTESSFLAFVRDNLGFNAASGGSGAIDGEVEYRADLPIVIGDPIVSSIYIVEKNTTLFGFKTYQNGLYIRQTNTGSLSDWERMNVKTNFTDSEFSIINAADTTKKAKFDASTITTGTDRTYIYPNKNGTFAMLSDISTNISAPLPIMVVTSTDNSTTFSQSTPLIIEWDVETYKDSGFSHNNVTNTTRLIVDNDGTYDIGGFLKVFDTDQRSQADPKILINGVLKDYGLASSYIRGNGASSDEWTLSFNFYPIKLNAGDYVEIQIGVISQLTVSFTPTLIGDESFFWIKNLQGTKGETGPTGVGSDIIVQKDDVTIGTVTSTLNFEGGISAAIDEGSDKTTLTVEKYYKQTSVNTVGGTINAPYGTPLECVPSSGTLEITVAESGSYIIYGTINIGTDLNKDDGALELAYGIDTGSGSSVSAQPWRQNQNAKKNKRNGIQGTWGDVNLSAGDKVYLYLSTLGDSTTWEEGEIFIATWK
jgi:hypothetical protein